MYGDGLAVQTAGKRDRVFGSQHAKKNAKEKEQLQNGKGRFMYPSKNSAGNQSKPKSPNLGVRAGGE